MKKISKALILLLSLLLLASCGQKQEEAIEINEDTTEVVATRSIVVSEVNGTVSVTHGNGEKLNAYEGMNLSDGDDVVVSASSNITLSIDSDKHIFAEENSHFWLYASGTEGKTKTIIRLDEGSVLCDINEKLGNEESFDIQTASSTMSVRGTVFRVCLLKGNDNSVFDLVEVYDGKVWSNIENSEDNLTLEPGQCALIRKTDSAEETAASFVLAEDIDEKFIKETGLNISLDQAEEGEKGALKISLENLSVETLSRLETIIEEGTKLSVEKEEIQEVKEIIETKKEEPKAEVKPETKQEEVKVEEKKEEPVVEEKHEEPKPVKCTHPNLQDTIIRRGDCCNTELHSVFCPDCKYSSQYEGQKDMSNHIGTVERYYDEPYIQCQGQRSYMYCDACHSEWDEQYSKPLDHKVESDGKCSYCGQQIEFRGSVQDIVSS